MRRPTKCFRPNRQERWKYELDEKRSKGKGESRTEEELLQKNIDYHKNDKKHNKNDHDNCHHYSEGNNVCRIKRDESMNWTRKEVKERAKAALKRNYWKAVFVSFIFILLSNGASSPSAYPHPDNTRNRRQARLSQQKDSPFSDAGFPHRHGLPLSPSAGPVYDIKKFLIKVILRFLRFLFKVEMLSFR